MKHFSSLLAALILLSGCSDRPGTTTGAAPPGADLPVYRIGYMICNSEKETLDRFRPFSAYLGSKLGVRFETVAIDTINFTREVADLHFTHTNSLLYIILHRQHGVDVLAAEQKDSLGHLSQGVIIAKKDSPINSVADLAGKSMIFGPMLAPTGFMAQVDLLQQSGMDPDRDLSFYTIPSGSYKHEKVVYGVLFDRYDAGALPIGDIENMVADGRLEADEVKVVAKADPIPYCNFGFTQKVDDGFAQRFKQAVLAITGDDTVEFDGETVRVLKRALVSGFIDIRDEDFDPVRRMAERTNMPPYQKF
ncbi:MAG: phosphate/phosphite/phosphonate ABC transporter substrate-binding protein [Thermodesulfobacteriota bacterium]